MRRIRVGPALVVVVVVVAALAMVACEVQRDDETAVIPPCQPVTDVDPCPPGGFAMGASGGAGGGGYERGDAPTPVSKMLGDGTRIFGGVHIVARVTFLPNTNRCTTGGPRRYADHLRDRLSGEGQPAYRCYIDARVNEYYVGEGPQTLTMLFFRYTYTNSEGPHEGTRRSLESLVGRAAGYEIVAFLTPTWDVAAEALTIIGYWGIQENDDGTVTAIHPASFLWEGADRQRHIAVLEMSLADLDAGLDAAHTTRMAQWGGRIGAAEDLPMLVTDANNLRDYYEAVGAYDDGHTPTQPPPVPEQ